MKNLKRLKVTMPNIHQEQDGASSDNLKHYLLKHVLKCYFIEIIVIHKVLHI